MIPADQSSCDDRLFSTSRRVLEPPRPCETQDGGAPGSATVQYTDDTVDTVQTQDTETAPDTDTADTVSPADTDKDQDTDITQT